MTKHTYEILSETGVNITPPKFDRLSRVGRAKTAQKMADSMNERVTVINRTTNNHWWNFNPVQDDEQ